MSPRSTSEVEKFWLWQSAENSARRATGTQIDKVAVFLLWRSVVCVLSFDLNIEVLLVGGLTQWYSATKHHKFGQEGLFRKLPT